MEAAAIPHAGRDSPRKEAKKEAAVLPTASPIQLSN